MPDNSRNRTSKYRLALKGISKQYPGGMANDNISLAIKPGTIHALLGENGAGKSTLMKIIYGVVKPDAGRIMWEGQDTVITTPAQARQLGIGMVFQQAALFETLTVLENIALVTDRKASRDRHALAVRVTDVARQYGMTVELQRPVHTLSTGERQRLDIVRCLMQDIKLLILDEPTSALTPQEVDTLFATLRELAAKGMSVLFISHKLKEVQILCDIATVLRHGAVIGSCKPAENSTSALARMMVGDATPVATAYPRAARNDVCLCIENLSVRSNEPFGVDLKNIDLDVQAGEIVGIAGVAGNGQSELLAALSGELTCEKSDVIRLSGVAIGAMPPDERRRRGLAFVPEDRLGHGAVADLSLRDNGLLTGFMRGLVTKGFLQKRAIAAFTEHIIEKYDVKCEGAHATANSLSGGNLQKFIIGRELLQNPACLIAAHPTLGVDVAAAVAIHNALLALRERGAAIVVVSEDTDELFAISDRMGALFRGQLSPLKPTVEISIEALGKAMAGLPDGNSDIAA